MSHDLLNPCALRRLVALLAERLQSPDAALFWENMALILHISASVRLDLLEEKVISCRTCLCHGHEHTSKNAELGGINHN